MAYRNVEERIKILRIIGRLNVGGPAIHVVNLTAGLAPGRYQITSKQKSRIGGCKVFEVDVTAGAITRVDWNCDSGMR